MELSINTGSKAAIYQQIIDQIRLAIAQGQLQAGAALPSVRALSKQLLVNPNTVSKAYGELVRSGALVSQHGRGVFVAEPRDILDATEQARRLQEAVHQLIHQATALSCSAADIKAALATELHALGLDGDETKKGHHD